MTLLLEHVSAYGMKKRSIANTFDSGLADTSSPNGSNFKNKRLSSPGESVLN